MAKTIRVAEVGEIKIFLSNDDSSLTLLELPIVGQDGEELVLKLSQPEYRTIWEMLSVLRQDYPKAMGLQ